MKSHKSMIIYHGSSTAVLQLAYSYICFFSQQESQNLLNHGKIRYLCPIYICSYDFHVSTDRSSATSFRLISRTIIINESVYGPFDVPNRLH